MTATQLPGYRQIPRDTGESLFHAPSITHSMGAERESHLSLGSWVHIKISLIQYMVNYFFSPRASSMYILTNKHKHNLQLLLQSYPLCSDFLTNQSAGFMGERCR